MIDLPSGGPSMKSGIDTLTPKESREKPVQTLIDFVFPMNFIILVKNAKFNILYNYIFNIFI